VVEPNCLYQRVPQEYHHGIGEVQSYHATYQ
jgi:hypothetical protein